MGRDIKPAIQQIISDKKSVSAHQLSQELEVSRQYVHRVLSELVDSGQVLKSGTPPKVLYRPGVQPLVRRETNKPKVVWLTGLPGSGKSTLAKALQSALKKKGVLAHALDSAEIRKGLSQDLGLTAKDKAENIRRIGEVAKIMNDANITTVVAATSPYASGRNTVRTSLPAGDFIEVYLSCPLEICKQRDTSGVYEKALAGKNVQAPGINAPYEVPENPEITIETDKTEPQEAVKTVLNYLSDN